MATMILQCVAPLQAWGIESQFTVRDTIREPSKSGIVGLLCAALGRDRSEPIDDLAALRIGVRVDRQGEVLRDYHTAGRGGYPLTTGRLTKDKMTVSTRYYLSDACFLVAIQGEQSMLQKIHAALRRPKWMLFLGRKSCVPSRPVWISAENWNWQHDPVSIFTHYPSLSPTTANSYRVVLDMEIPFNETTTVERRTDVPLSFARGKRQFAARQVKIGYLSRILSEEETA